MTEYYDLFICHATEDKENIARPLYQELTVRGYSVWFDEYSLTLGDSLRRCIEKGLARSRFGIVILSPAFFAKKWTQYELDALTQREMGDEEKVILPVWHGVTANDVRHFSLALADRVGIVSSAGMDAILASIERAVGLASGIRRLEIKNVQCPQCGSEVRAYTRYYEGTKCSGELHCKQCDYIDLWGGITAD